MMMCQSRAQDDYSNDDVSLKQCQSRAQDDDSNDDRYGEQKIAQFRTHYLTKELSYVSTQQSGYFQ